MANDIPRNIMELSAQNELTMVGLVTFENKLKAETKEAIDKLSNSKI
jgi:magnesium-transporting ATPase (P-type)